MKVQHQGMLTQKQLIENLKIGKAGAVGWFS